MRRRIQFDPGPSPPSASGKRTSTTSSTSSCAPGSPGTLTSTSSKCECSNFRISEFWKSAFCLNVKMQASPARKGNYIDFVAEFDLLVLQSHFKQEHTLFSDLRRKKYKRSKVFKWTNRFHTVAGYSLCIFFRNGVCPPRPLSLPYMGF